MKDALVLKIYLTETDKHSWKASLYEAIIIEALHKNIMIPLHPVKTQRL